MAEKVVVAMSGGVDSSVAAALLLEQGYDVTGIMLKLWTGDCEQNENACCTPESIAQARAVAATLHIPFYVIDAKQDFKENVVDQFIRSYQRGWTPNPCFACNQTIKWGFLLEKAIQMGADLISTGHYAQISKDTAGIYHLAKGYDDQKDQSYVLAGLTQEQLSRTLLPLGKLKKAEVRNLAEQFGFDIAQKPDSQDLCFVGKEGYRGFLQTYGVVATSPGIIRSVDGRKMGEHKGLFNYTIGQRKGIGSGMGVPMYVIDIDIEENELVIGTKDQLGANVIHVQRINWMNKANITADDPLQVKIRYKSAPMPCRVIHAEQESFSIILSEPLRDITPGQIAVIYNQNEVAGSAMILSSERVEN